MAARRFRAPFHPLAAFTERREWKTKREDAQTETDIFAVAPSIRKAATTPKALGVDNEVERHPLCFDSIRWLVIVEISYRLIW